MSEHPEQAAASPSRTCTSCNKPIEQEWELCPFCGTRILPATTIAAIDIYIQNKVTSVLSDRLTDQNSLVRELGDKAEVIVWQRLRGYGFLIVIIIAIIGFYGIKTYNDLFKTFMPVVKDTEQRVQAAKRTTDETTTKVDSVKASVDRLSRDVDIQTKRVAEKGGEISQKFDRLDAAANELSGRLTAMAKSLETTVAQVAKQVEQCIHPAGLSHVRTIKICHL